jgi:plant cysteine oxidase
LLSFILGETVLYHLLMALSFRFGVRPIHDFIHPPKHEYKNDSCVRYLHIAEVEGSYSIGIFVFPPHAHMPLHDHPDMCVLSRILYGEVVKTALDLERESMPQQRESWISNVLWPNSNNNKPMSPAKNAKRARKTATELLKAPAVATLFPYEGNLHEFVAGPQGAAILDVLLPPYGNSRDCTFYNIQEDGTHSESCWIVPTGQPESFHCLSGRYRNLGRDDSMDEEFEGQDKNT